MAFFIPDEYARFSCEVFDRFKILLSKNIFTGISQLTFRQWLANFQTEEESYLAAHLVDSLILRTDLMLDSTSRHIVEMCLPKILKRHNNYTSPDISSFTRSLSSGDLSLGLRFVAVDGTFSKAPAKSGATLIRIFSRATGIPKRLLVRPENLTTLPDTVKTLIFLDDCVGTGRQFDGFCDSYQLSTLASRFELVYIPLLGHQQGIDFLNQRHPHVKVYPVEVLGPSCNFFQSSASNLSTWAKDNTNSVGDVQNFYDDLLRRKGVSKESEFCLNLSLAFSFSTPNNTLKAYFSDQGTWNRLLVR